MKKLFLFALLVSFLMAETALAAEVKVNWPWEAGKEVSTSFRNDDPAIGTTWSYCVQSTTSITAGVWYDYDLVDVAAYPGESSKDGLDAAWLIYSSYGDAIDSVYNGNDAATIMSSANNTQTLQDAIWEVFNTDTSYYGSGWNDSDIANLSNLFDIVVTADVAEGYTQDLIIYNPGGPSVPVPASVWLLGSGLSGLLVLRRKKK